MRKVLRVSLLSLFAMAFSTLAFADGKDVSGKIWNGDAEEGLQGWEVTFSTDNNVDGRIWKISNHTEGLSAGSMGYWGFDKHCLEIWGGQTDGVGNPVGKNSISQLVTGLENGTYVFGAFTIATIQSHGTSENKTKYIPTKDDVEGAYMFANDVKTYIATNDPEAADSLPAAHAVKLNVAAQVVDGSLKFGFGCDEGSTASFICVDNATLYYFGDMEPAAALVEAYKMDLQKAVAASDTLKKYPMAVAVLADLNAAAEAAASANSVEDCMAAEENVRLANLAARFSIYNYNKLVQLIEKAKETLSKEWSDFIADQVADLEAATAQAEADLAAGEMSTDELTEYLKDFENTINKVEIDELYELIDALDQFINDFESISESDPNVLCGGFHPGFGEEVGQYPYSEQETLSALLEEAQILLGGIEDESVPATDGVAMIEKIKGAVAACIANANKEPVLPFDAILVPDPDDPTKPLLRKQQSGLANDAAITPYKQTSWRTPGEDPNVFRYESPVFGLPYVVDKLVITVTHTIYNDRPRDEGYNDGPYFNLTEFYLFDENGDEIELTADDFSSNAREPSEGSYAGLLDGDINTFFHSRWSSKNNETGYHTLEISMPQDLQKFSFAMEVIFNDTRISNMPTEIVVSGMTHTKADLSNAISDAEGSDVMSFVEGTEPGFNSGDFSKIEALKAELSKAKEMLANEDATDEEIVAATIALEEAHANADGVGDFTFILPEPGVAYKLANQAPFVKGQGKVKNMTVFQDSILWWADADPADEYQDFTFEKIDGPDEEDIYFNIKNVKTGKYIGYFTEEPGYEGDNEIIWGNNWHIRLSETPAPIRMRSLGFGQVHFWAPKDVDDTSWLGIHACNHNNGNASTSAGSQGGGKGFSDHPDGFSIHGVCGPIVQWGTDAYGASAWYIRQQEELPLSILLSEGFDKKPHHLYTPVDVMTLQADRACAFANLKLIDILGEEIEFTAEKSDAFSIVVTFTEHTETFYLSFDNAEGVGTITVTGGIAEKSPLAKLQEAYDAVASTEYTVGTAIGCVKDLSALDDAKAKAEELLKAGREVTAEEVDAAIAALDAAVAGLEVVMPEEGKSYFIVNAFEPFEENFGVPVALFSNADNGMPGWTYISINNPAFEWQFEFVDDEKKDFRLFNVGTQDYISGSTGGDNVMTDSNGGLYALVARGNQKFNILNTDPGASNDGSAGGTWMIHPHYHNSGSTPFGSICMWGNDNPTKSEWYIKESGTVKTSIDEIAVEPERLNVASGTYDLTGRRVATPEKGLYIQNGKKILVK